MLELSHSWFTYEEGVVENDILMLMSYVTIKYIL